MFLNDEIDFFGEELTEVNCFVRICNTSKIFPSGDVGPLLNAYIACCDI